MFIWDLFLLSSIGFLIANIILVAKKKKNKVYGVIGLIFNLLIPILALSSFTAFASISSSESGMGMSVSLIPLIIVLVLSIANVVLSCIILPNNKTGDTTNKKEEQKEIEKHFCNECNCEAEETNKIFANTTEELKLQLRKRQWYDVFTTFNITYKCPQCGKTWTENVKEKTGKKQKQYDETTKTWYDRGGGIF